MTRLAAFFLLLALFLASCGGDDDDDSAQGGTADDDNDDDNDSGDDDDDDDGADDDDDDDASPLPHLIAAPDEPGYDADLEAFAYQYERSFHVFNALGMGLNSDLSISTDREEDRELIRAFLQESDGWDFPAYSGKQVFDVVDSYNAVAGLYAGVGIAADAFRYGCLRDQGYPQEEVDRAREFLLTALDGLCIAVEITGVPGIIARGYLRTDIPGNAGSTELTPLFDGDGNPLPPEKTNGTWRADNSGLFPNYIWLDSCSRDQYIGWMAALAGAWEVIKDDPTFPDALKDRLRGHARDIGRQLKVVRESGFDLEIFDADGRTTYHGYMNENNYDRVYLPWLPIKNGMYSLMAIGSLAALLYVSEDEELADYLHNELLGSDRQLDWIYGHNQVGIDLWIWSNYSSYNMAFMGGWLAYRYLDDGQAREAAAVALRDLLYDKPMWPFRQPKLLKQSFFDFTVAGALAGSTAWSPMSEPPDAAAVERGLETLREFKAPPFWDYATINCDDAEIDAGQCLAADGVTELKIMPILGRGDKVVSQEAVPMHTRPPSNYYWRSNPYEVNGDGGVGGGTLLPGVDFRWAYWMGRWTR